MKMSKPFGVGAMALVAALGLMKPMQAQALPLLSENAAQTVAGLLTLYPDHENPNLFYFMPNSAEIARDSQTQVPLLGFTYWGLSNNGPITEAGAYLTFTARLKSDADQKTALEEFLKTKRRVAVLPVMASTIGLTSTKGVGADGKPVQPLGKLFDEFNFSRVGGRAEDEIGVNAVMTGIGAKVFKAAIQSPQLIKVDYCYKVQGLGPNFDAVIDIDWKRVYDHFSFRASGGGWFTKWSVALEIEKLKQDNAIKIHVNGGTATDEEYVRSMADKIVTRLFKPELDMKPTNPGSGGGWSFSRVSLAYTHREELKHEHWEYKRRDLIEREFCSNVRLNDLGAHKDKVVFDADKN